MLRCAEFNVGTRAVGEGAPHFPKNTILPSHDIYVPIENFAKKWPECNKNASPTPGYFGKFGDILHPSPPPSKNFCGSPGLILGLMIISLKISVPSKLEYFGQYWRQISTGFEKQCMIFHVKSSCCFKRTF